jgi:hypothetical protein
VNAADELNETAVDDLARRPPMGYLTTAAKTYARAAAGGYLTLDAARAEFLAYARVTGDVLSGKPATAALIERVRTSDMTDPGVVELLEGCVELYRSGDATAVERAAVTYTTWFDGGKI